MPLHPQRSGSVTHYYLLLLNDGLKLISLLVCLLIFFIDNNIKRNLYITASKRLSDLIRRPYDLYRAGVFDEYLMGLMNQVAQAMDDSITQEVTNHLFKKEGAR